MEDLKSNIAKNITELRTREKITQAELAERLNYSDKAISKWERGESLPDVTVIKQIADMFGVTVDWLLCDNTDVPVPQSNRKNKNNRIITVLSFIGVWCLATLVFVALVITSLVQKGAWLVFIGALPVSFITLLVLNSIWGKIRLNQYIISGLLWSLLTFIYLLFLVCFGYNHWVIFLIGIPGQAAVLLSHRIRRK